MRPWLAALLLVALLALALFPSLAFAAGAPEVSSLEVQSYQQDFGVSAAVAEGNLKTQQRGVGIVEQLHETLGKRYAGVWFDNESGEFVVPTLTTSAAVSSALRGSHLAEDFRTTPAQYSWEELEVAQEQITQGVEDLSRESLVQTSLDPRTNAVVVYESEDASVAVGAELESLAESSNVKVEVEEETPGHAETLKCHSAARVCGAPLRGGIGIGPNIKAFGADCTSAFKAIGNVYGNRFVLTAGHCVFEGPSNWATQDADHEYKTESVGTVEEYNFPGGDWAKLNANGTYWDKQPSWPSEIAYWGVDQDYPITAESSSYLGEYVCHSGLTSGLSCGSVTGLNIWEKMNSGFEEFHLTKVEGSELCAQGGDSGGPIFAGHTALGILSAGEVGCGAGTYITYVEIIEATEALGVTVGSRVGATPVAETNPGASSFPLHGATVSGSVDPNGLSTNYHFDYGPTTAYGSSSSLVGAGAGWGPGPANGTLTGLKGNTPYHFRLVAQNSAGIGYGTDQSFTTPDWRPIVTTDPAEAIHQEATLKGTVNPQERATTYHFEYGPTTSYGTKVPIPDASAGSGTSAVPVSQKLTGLADGTYHYRIVASNEEGTSSGTDREFLIDNRPIVVAEAPTSITSGSATLKGKIEPQNFTSTYHFELINDAGFKTDSYTYATKLPVPDASAGTGFEYHAISQATGTILEPETTYHYRLVATNVKGTRIGEEKTFRTAAVMPVKDLSFGKEGSGTAGGEFGDMSALAADGSGNVWVLDAGINSRVQKFDPEGKFLSQFGKAGSGDGEFSSPNGIAIAPAGNIWVADTFNNRAQQFSSAGAFVSKFGSSGEGNTQFKLPQGVAIDQSSANIWIADYNNHRVQEFNSKGEFIRSVKGGGSNGPELVGVAGLAVDKSGNVWVVDEAAGRVVGYSSTGTYIGQVGKKGSGAGELLSPTAVAFLPSGAMIVADGEGATPGRLQEFSTSGEYLGLAQSNASPYPRGLAVFGNYIYVTEVGGVICRVSRLHIPQVKATSSAAASVKAKRATPAASINPNGSAVTYRFEYGLTKAYGSKAPASDKSLGSETGSQEVQQEITGLSPSTTYHYRIVAFNANGASYGEDKTLTTTAVPKPTATTEAAAPVGYSQVTLNGTVNPNEGETFYLFQYGKTISYGSYIPALPNGSGIAQNIGSGYENVKVSQTPSLEPNTIYHFRVSATNEGGTTNGEDKTFTTPRAYNPPTYSSAFGSSGTGNGQFSAAWGLAIDPANGNIWVADKGNNRIQKFNSKGEFLCKIGESGTGNGQFKWPRNIAIDSSGNAWVTDSLNNRVQKINSSCEYVSQFGKEGAGNGQFSGNFGIAIDAEGNVWVTDFGHDRIEKFNSKGEYLSQFGISGSGEGQIDGPEAIKFDSEGNLLVSDMSGHLQKFTPKGEFLGQLATEVTNFGFDPKGNIWTTAYYLNAKVRGFFAEGGESFAQLGKPGSGAGEFTTPRGITADAGGNVWIVDSANNRIQKWTASAQPAVMTETAKSIKRTEATLKGNINPEATATSYQFQYGTTTSFGTTVPASPKSIGSGSTGVEVSEALSGLKANTTYYYHVVATNSKGTFYGETRSFKTLPAAGVGAVLRIGGKTFTELGIKEASFSSFGPFKIEAPTFGGLTINCTESATGTLVSTGVSKENVTLYNCSVAGNAACEVKPITYSANGSYQGEGTILTTLTIVNKGGCSMDEHMELQKPSAGGFEFGTEAVSINVNPFATSKFGMHPFYFSGNSTFQLVGANTGKTLGFW